MATELTLEQKRSLSLAKARASVAQQAPSWGSVLKDAPVKGVAAGIDQVINTPEQFMNLMKMVYGTGVTAAGAPEMAPDVEAPPNRLTEMLDTAGFIESDNSNMTQAQRLVDSGIQGATLGVIAPAQGLKQMATNAFVSGTGSATGTAVGDATGSEMAALAASMAVPGGAASRVSPLTAARRAEQARMAERTKTLRDAVDAGFMVVPEGRVAEFANRKRMLNTAVAVNKRKTNDAARRALQVPPTTAITDSFLGKYRNDAYQSGYLPLKALGKFTVDMPYLNDLMAIEQKYTGQGGSFPASMPKKLKAVIDDNFVADVTAEDVVDRVKLLRARSSKNLKSEDPINIELGWAQKEVARAMEDVLDRHATASGAPPAVMENYRKARKQIAISHTVGDALVQGSGEIDGDKLARAFQRGEFMDGDMAVAARFYNINQPKIEPKDAGLPYSYATGLAAGALAARHFGIEDPLASAAAAAGGTMAGRALHDIAGKPVRDYLMSPMGQKNSLETYGAFGPQPGLALPAMIGTQEPEQ